MEKVNSEIVYCKAFIVIAFICFMQSLLTVKISGNIEMYERYSSKTNPKAIYYSNSFFLEPKAISK